MYKTFILISLLIITTIIGCSNKESIANNNSIDTVAVTANTSDIQDPKDDRDFAFVLFNSRQQFKDVAKIGTDAYKNYVEKKIDSNEFTMKIEEMQSQFQKELNVLKNAKATTDTNLKMTHDELVDFISTYYLDLLYKESIALANKDNKDYQDFADKLRLLEGKYREIDKKMSDLKTEYKF